MKVAFALLARDVRVTDPRAVDLLGVFDRVELPASAFPARFESLYLVVRYEVHRTELGRPQLVEILVSDEDGDVLFRVGRRLTVVDRAWGEMALGVPEYAIQAYGIHGLTLAAPGAYAFDVLLNGTHAAHLTLFVRATPDPPDAAAPPSAASGA